MSFSQKQKQKQIIKPLQYKEDNILLNYNRITKGFENPHNRCYQNSLFQALFNIPTFQYFLKNYSIKEDDENLLFLIKNLFLSLYDDITLDKDIKEKYDFIIDDFISDDFIETLFETRKLYVQDKDSIMMLFKMYISEKKKDLTEEYINKYLDFLKKIIYSNFSNQFKKIILKLFYSQNEENLMEIKDKIYINELQMNEYFDKQLKHFYEDIKNLDLYKSMGINRPIKDIIYEYFPFLRNEKFKKYIDLIERILQSKIITDKVKKNILIMFYNGNDIDEYPSDEQYNYSFQYDKEPQRFTKSIFEEKLEQEVISKFKYKQLELKDINLTEQYYNKIIDYYKKHEGINFSNFSIQQDSSEFFIYLYDNIEKFLIPLTRNIEIINKKLNDLCEKKEKYDKITSGICQDLNITFKNLTTFNEINRLFKIFLINEKTLNIPQSVQLTHPKEDYIKYNMELHDTLKLSINKDEKNDDLIHLINVYMNESPTIEDFIYDFQQPLKIKRNINEKYYFLYLPNILTIHIKRFDFVSIYITNKLKNNVNIPLELDLKEFIHPSFEGLNSKTKYILCSAVLHLSESVSAGHYVTINRDMKNQDNFYLYNDTSITEITPYNKDIDGYEGYNINNSAYILFYMKV